MNLIIIRGLPGSGKTTLANRIGESIQSNWTHYEADMYFTDTQGNYKWDRNKLREAHAWCLEKTREDMHKGYTVIVSNTFTTRRELNPYFDIAREWGITPTVITCENDWGSVHNVPPETMGAMRLRFERDLTAYMALHQKTLESVI